MTLICPLLNTLTALVLLVFSLLQYRSARKRTRRYALQCAVRNAALLVGALFGLCTNASDLILMSALMNGAVLVLDGISDIAFSCSSQAAMHFLLAAVNLIGMVLYLKA